MQHPHPWHAALTALALASGAACAQQPQQKVSPPEAQAWIDLATYSGFGMGAMGSMGGGGGGAGGGAMAVLGGMLGNATGLNTNRFGNTHTGLAGRWMDVTLSVRRQPALAEASMAVPQGSGLAPTLKLVSPKAAPPAPRSDDEREVEPHEHEKPKGKVSLYWGCGDEVRAGQPRTVDFASALPQDLMQVFNGRRATQRGTHSAAGRPLWPSEPDSRMVPANAVLAGEMGFSGTGVPENFRFNLPAAQDLMPPLELQQAQPEGNGGATRLSWAGLPTARGYFIAALGARKGEEGHLVLWTSSELPDSGFGLVDYQTNGAVDRWLREKVLLPAGATSCTVPKGVFAGEGAMLRAIAYGSELNLAHPPRPTDPKLPWDPEWAVKVRLKSVTMAMLGMDMGGGKRDKPPAEEGGKKPSKLDLLRGILGR